MVNRFKKVWRLNNPSSNYQYTLYSDLNSQRKQPVILKPSDPESGVRVTCDEGYLCADFDLPRPLCS